MLEETYDDISIRGNGGSLHTSSFIIRSGGRSKGLRWEPRNHRELYVILLPVDTPIIQDGPVDETIWTQPMFREDMIHGFRFQVYESTVQDGANRPS